MPFKKLNIPLKDVLEHLKYEEATPFQQKVIPKIKGGEMFLPSDQMEQEGLLH